MPESAKNARKPVTLEQLLQLKRSERPDPAFWEGFDRELRRRQLAALVNVRSWYERVGHAVTLALRRAAPIGATVAALAAGVVVWDMKDHATPTVEAAEIDPDSRPVLLPEEHIVSSSQYLGAAGRLPSADRPQPRYVVPQFATSRGSTGAFTINASPVTFSSRPAPQESASVPGGM